MLYARLHPPAHQAGVPYTGSYSVEFDGQTIVSGSRNPECDAARVLAARGITGKLTLVDANTLKPRTITDIVKAAKLTVKEGPLRFEKLSTPDRSPTAEEDLVLPTLPDEEEQAA
jgi:hypothetical protein